MKRLLLCALVAMSACTHKSEVKHETGQVVEKSFSPEFDGTTTNYSSKGVSFGDVHKDEQFVTVFKCEHGVVFTIDNKDIYGKLNKGDVVDIEFKDIIWNSDNTVKKYDFIDANKK